MRRLSARLSKAMANRAGVSLLFSLWLLIHPRSLSGQEVTTFFVPPSAPFIAGSQGRLWLYCLNGSSNAVNQSFPANLEATLTSPSASTRTVLILNSNAGEATATAIAPGSFVKKAYLWSVPVNAGEYRLDISNYNQLSLTVQNGPSASAPAPPANPTAPPSTETKRKVHRQLMELQLEHLSNYEPIYFILGSYPAAEFQISIKYQVFSFTNEANIFENVLDHGFFAYTQTSFWDVLSHDPRFYDTSYKPSVFLYYTNVLRSRAGKSLQLDLQGGTEHESNGQGGATERSLYTGYLQPTLTVALPENLQLMFQPRARFYYLVGDNNPDIAQYRGYADLLTALTWQDPDSEEKIQFSTKLRIGDTGTHLGLLFDLRFNLTDLGLFHAFNPTIQVQYFTGYGQTLLQYNHSSQAIRAGLCLWY